MGYQTFAQYYDAAMGDRTPDIEYLKKLIRQHKPEARTLLELGCGTGEVLKAFNGSMTVTGVDNSPEMLAIAKAKVPDVHLVQADMTMYNSGEQFDLVLCVFDAVNHLLERGQWKQLFTSARQNLARDGLFIFDINTLHKLEKFAAGDMQGTEFGGNYYMTKVGKAAEGTNIYDWTVKVFEKEPNEEFLLHEEHVSETSFPIPEVMEMVESVFLEYVIMEDPFLGQVSENSNRVVFMCK